MNNDLTILVVDDNDSIRFFMEKMLTQMGVGKVMTASTYYEVQHKLDGQKVDGAFLDLVLQHGSGLDVGRHLRAMKIPIIFCSGVSDEYNVKQMYSLGFVFEKPVNMYQINRGLEYFKQLKGMRDE